MMPTVGQPAPSFAPTTLPRFRGRDAEKSADAPFYPADPKPAVQKPVLSLNRMVRKMIGMTVKVSDESQRKIDEFRALEGSDTSVLFLPNHPTGKFDILAMHSLGLNTTYLGAVDVLFLPRNPIIRKIPVLNQLKAKLVQWSGVTSVDREKGAGATIDAAVDRLKAGENLTLYPEGMITGTVDDVQQDKIKPGAARIATRVVRETDGERNVLQAPFAWQFDMLGDRKKIRRKLENAVDYLEKRAAKKTGHTFDEELPTLTARMERLFDLLVSQREQLYGERYGVAVDHTAKTSYDRLDQMREQVLATLEEKYLGQAQTGKPHERRARKLKGVIVQQAQDGLSQNETEKAEGKRKSRLKLWGRRQKHAVSSSWQDNKALTDIISLTKYPANYLIGDHDQARLTETYVKLAEDLLGGGSTYGKMRSLDREIRFLRRAEIIASLRVGEPVDTRQELALADSDEAAIRAMSQKLYEELLKGVNQDA